MAPVAFAPESSFEHLWHQWGLRALVSTLLLQALVPLKGAPDHHL